MTTGGGEGKSLLFSVKSSTLMVADMITSFNGWPCYEIKEEGKGEGSGERRGRGRGVERGGEGGGEWREEGKGEGSGERRGRGRGVERGGEGEEWEDRERAPL